MRQLIPVLIAASLSALVTQPAAAQATTLPGVDYRLDDGSTFQRGCFGPCACPVGAIVPVRGTFRLAPSGTDPLFARYAVTNVDWTVSQPGATAIPIVGSGTFKIGGEVAVTEELSLDLVVGSDAAQHFDSGMVVPSVQFPLLDLTISIDGAYCYDTVIRVRARPFPRLHVGPDLIRWDPDPPATFYDVVRGDLGLLKRTAGDYREATESCVANDLAALSVPFTLVPGVGDGYWILLRTKGGSYDAWDSMLAAPRDPGIDAATGSCP
jgi:hypothetical protein